MNEADINKLNVSLTMHFKKIKKTDKPCVYLIKESNAMNAQEALICCKPENITSHFDMDNRMNQWLMNQLTTYEVDKQAIFGIILNNGSILSHVVNVS